MVYICPCCTSVHVVQAFPVVVLYIIFVQHSDAPRHKLCTNNPDKEIGAASSDKEVIGQTTMKYSREDTAEAIRPSTPIIEYQIEKTLPGSSGYTRASMNEANRSRSIH